MEPMTEEKTGSEDLANRVAALEREAAALRRSIAEVARRLPDPDPEIEAFIEEFSDRPMSAEEMEAAFDRFDAALDAKR